MSKEKSVPEMVMEQEKEGVIVFMGIEGAMGAKISEFIQQPADGILYDLNRDKATLLSQYSKDNVRWINDYAVAVTITSLRAELERVKAENEWIPVSTWLLPPKNTDVLVYNSEDGNVFTACRIESGWYDKHEGVELTAYNDIITHWKSLPAAPEED